MVDEVVSLQIAVVTVSDTRTEETDRSGAVLVQRLGAAGHVLCHKSIVKDDVYQLRAEVSG
jgi:molybdenum cofactor biosynthesis protein B